MYTGVLPTYYYIVTSEAIGQCSFSPKTFFFVFVEKGNLSLDGLPDAKRSLHRRLTLKSGEI